MSVRRARKEIMQEIAMLSSSFNRIVKDDGDKRFLIRDRTYKYGRTSEEQIFQGVITLL